VLAEYTGDALYAVALFFVLRSLWPAARTATLAIAALLGATLVEFAQLLDWRWLVELRATRPGALLLGQGFQWADLIAYSIGVGAAVAVDLALARRGS
jgi:hypothetical protein